MAMTVSSLCPPKILIPANIKSEIRYGVRPHVKSKVFRRPPDQPVQAPKIPAPRGRPRKLPRTGIPAALTAQEEKKLRKSQKAAAKYQTRKAEREDIRQKEKGGDLVPARDKVLAARAAQNGEAENSLPLTTSESVGGRENPNQTVAPAADRQPDIAWHLNLETANQPLLGYLPSTAAHTQILSQVPKTIPTIGNSRTDSPNEHLPKRRRIHISPIVPSLSDRPLESKELTYDEQSHRIERTNRGFFLGETSMRRRKKGQRGRTKNTRLAVFRLSQLHDFEWFIRQDLTPEHQTSGMRTDQGDDIPDAAESSSPPGMLSKQTQDPLFIAEPSPIPPNSTSGSPKSGRKLLRHPARGDSLRSRSIANKTSSKVASIALDAHKQDDHLPGKLDNPARKDPAEEQHWERPADDHPEMISMQTATLPFVADRQIHDLDGNVRLANMADGEKTPPFKSFSPFEWSSKQLEDSTGYSVSSRSAAQTAEKTSFPNAQALSTSVEVVSGHHRLALYDQAESPSQPTTEFPNRDRTKALPPSSFSNGASQPCANIIIADDALNISDKEELPVEKGVAARGGSLGILRRKIILDILHTCGGVFPGHGELTGPFVTSWMKHNKPGKPDKRTIYAAFRSLVQSARVRELKFSFQSSQGLIVTQSMITSSDISPIDPKVIAMQNSIIACYPKPYIPEVVDVSPDLRSLSFTQKFGDGKPVVEVEIDDEVQLQVQRTSVFGSRAQSRHAKVPRRQGRSGTKGSSEAEGQDSPMFNTEQLVGHSPFSL